MAATGTGQFIIRPAAAGDMRDVQAVVTRSGLSSGQPAALEYYRTGPGCRLIVACQHDRVTGVSYAVSFGPDGSATWPSPPAPGAGGSARPSARRPWTGCGRPG